MTVEIASADRPILERLIEDCQLGTLSESVHYCIEIHRLRQLETGVPVDAEWVAYAKAAIAEGPADIEAGRVIDGDEFLRELKDRSLEA